MDQALNSDAQSDRAMERTALWSVSLGWFITLVMVSSVNIAIPAINEAMPTDAVTISWLITGFVLTQTIFLLPAAKWADLYGRKRIFIVGLAVSTAASLGAAMSNSIAMLLFSRFVQGIGAAMTIATGMAILSAVFPPARRGRAIGTAVAAVYIGLCCGPFLGGILIGLFSWRAVFLLPVPVALAVIFAAETRLYLPGPRDPATRFDIAGFTILASALSCTIYGVSILPTVAGTVLTVTGFAAICGFVSHQRGRTQPLLDVNIFFGNRLFSFSCLATMLIYAASYSSGFMISLYLQFIKGLSPESAGGVLVSQAVIMALVSPLAGRLSDRFPARILSSIGIVGLVAGLLLLSRLSANTPTAYVVVALGINGLGFGLFSAPNTNTIMGSVASHHINAAAAASNTLRAMGNVFSMGLVAVVFSLLLGPVQIQPHNYPQLVESINVYYVIAASLGLMAMAFSLSRGRAP